MIVTGTPDFRDFYRVKGFHGHPKGDNLSIPSQLLFLVFLAKKKDTTKKGYEKRRLRVSRIPCWFLYAFKISDFNSKR